MLRLRSPIPLLAITILLVVPVKATTSYYQGTTGDTNFHNSIGGLTLLSPTLTFSSGTLVTGGLLDANGTGINFLGFDNFANPADFTINAGKLTATQQAQQATIVFPPPVSTPLAFT